MKYTHQLWPNPQPLPPWYEGVPIQIPIGPSLSLELETEPIPYILTPEYYYPANPDLSLITISMPFSYTIT